MNQGSDRIAEAIVKLDVDIVINVQGDEPPQCRTTEKVIEVLKDVDKSRLASLRERDNQ
jgi:CMP-2-keto-3-deoxyoctulosonic acid synthetase